ncbi:MAG TPA: hypothetical protein VMB02_05740 [Candidatus Aquilonibacter sp.]|nr:hypothetical protein [Candidatus Aquilonibacter sp.]
MRAALRRRAIAGVTPIVLALLVAAPASFGWGENADRLITNKAVDTLPDEMGAFFEANRQFLVQHVTDANEDVAKNAVDPRSNFIELDHYGQFPFSSLPRSYSAALAKYGRRSIETYGLLPWQVGLYSQKLTDAFRARNWAEVKLNAALLAHYVAAASDPFNTTVNSDGRLSDQPGVNERFGVGLVDRYQLFFFVKPNDAAFIRDPTEEAFEMTLNAHSWLENVLLADRRAHEGLSTYGDTYYDRFYAQAGAVLIRQFSDASTDVGSYWMTAWINAGRPPLPSN